MNKNELIKEILVLRIKHLLRDMDQFIGEIRNDIGESIEEIIDDVFALIDDEVDTDGKE